MGFAETCLFLYKPLIKEDLITFSLNYTTNNSKKKFTKQLKQLCYDFNPYMKSTYKSTMQNQYFVTKSAYNNFK